MNCIDFKIKGEKPRVRPGKTLCDKMGATATRPKNCAGDLKIFLNRLRGDDLWRCLAEHERLLHRDRGSMRTTLPNNKCLQFCIMLLMYGSPVWL